MLRNKYIVDMKSEVLDTSSLSVDAFVAFESVMRGVGVVYTETYLESLVPTSVRFFTPRLMDNLTIIEDDAALYKPTTGLSVGTFDMDTSAGTISVTINDRNYVFKPLENVDIGQLYKSVTGMAKYSVGKALAYLKSHAVGVRVEHLTKVAEFSEWISTLNCIHESIKYSTYVSSRPVIEARAHGVLVGSWNVSKKSGLVDSETQIYDNYEAFENDVKTYHPQAIEVKSDTQGVVLFLDPDTKVPIATWTVARSRGRIAAPTTESSDPILAWLHAQDKGAEE